MRMTILALVLASVVGGGLAAENPKGGDMLSGSGILSDVKPDSVMIWVDATDVPVRFKLPEGFDKTTFTFPPKGKGIFSVHRVRFTYAKGDAANTLLTIQKDAVPETGTVTGTVIFADPFWVAVKPKFGPLDGYAVANQPGMSDRLKALHKGDTVSIKFHTDVERHRIETLDVVALGAAAAAGPAAKPALKLPDGVKILRDIEYAKVGEKSLLLDIYTPATPKGKLPLVVEIHGGAWKGGAKEDNPPVNLAARDYIVACINYRLSSEAIFPAQIEDCKGAIRFLRANAAKYLIDGNHIGVQGGSSGGHLASLLGTSGDVKELEGTVGGNLGVSSRVQCVVDFFGPSDLNKFKGQPVWPKVDDPKSPLCLLVGGLLADKQDLVAKANPITYIAKDCPPFFVTHGNADNAVPLNQSQLLVAALKKAGVGVTFEVVKGGGHGFNPEQNQRLEPLINAFLDQNLKSVGALQPTDPTAAH